MEKSENRPANPVIRTLTFNGRKAVAILDAPDHVGKLVGYLFDSLSRTGQGYTVAS